MVLTCAGVRSSSPAIALVVTAPFLPWASYIAQFGDLSTALAVQSDGGLSATALPWLIPIALIALVRRSRARRLAVGPGAVARDAVVLLHSRRAGAEPIAAALIAIPMPGAAVLAAPSSPIQRRTRAWTASLADWRRRRPGAEGMP